MGGFVGWGGGMTRPELTEAIGKIVAAQDPNRFWEFLRERLAAVKQLPLRGVAHEPLEAEVVNAVVRTYLEPHKALVQSTWPAAISEIIAAYDGKPMAVWKEPVREVFPHTTYDPQKWEQEWKRIRDDPDQVRLFAPGGFLTWEHIDRIIWKVEGGI